MKKGAVAASDLRSPSRSSKSCSFSTSLQVSGAEPNLPLSWAGKLWVAHGLAMSSVLASGCLDQFNLSHVTPTVCFVFYFCPSFPTHCSKCGY